MAMQTQPVATQDGTVGWWPSRYDFDPTTEQARAAWMAANVAQLTPG